MKNAKFIISIILILGIATGGYFLYGYIYDNLHYLETENAKVSAKTYSVVPPKAGQIKDWYVNEGDYVEEDQLLGRETDSTRIKAPAKGAVIKTNAVENQLVNTTTELALIADLSNIYIQSNIEETHFSKIKVGQDVDITLDAYPGKKFEGKIYEVNLSTQLAFSAMQGINTSGTYTKTTQLVPVKISIDNKENLPLTIGMNAYVKIRVKD